MLRYVNQRYYTSEHCSRYRCHPESNQRNTERRYIYTVLQHFSHNQNQCMNQGRDIDQTALCADQTPSLTEQQFLQARRLQEVDMQHINNTSAQPVPEVIKLFPCSTLLSTKFILPINVKMPTIVGILTFISMINTPPDRLQARNFFICRYSSFNEQLKFRAQLS